MERAQSMAVATATPCALPFFFDFETLQHNIKGADGENITEQIG